MGMKEKASWAPWAAIAGMRTWSSANPEAERPAGLAGTACSPSLLDSDLEVGTNAAEGGRHSQVLTIWGHSLQRSWLGFPDQVLRKLCVQIALSAHIHGCIQLLKWRVAQQLYQKFNLL